MRRLATNKLLFIIIILSLSIRLSLFGYAVIKAPSAKLMPDSVTYIEPGVNLIEKGLFATFDDSGNTIYEVNRTPGYPIFIAFLMGILKLSFDSIILVQILLLTFAGYIVYKTAYELDKNIAPLAAFIFLFDQPTTISALMLLTEALYTVFMAIFTYFFLNYLKEYRIRPLVYSALTLAIATYIKPVSYYLGICLAAGVIYVLFRKDFRKAVAHGLILLLLFYSLLGIWHYRNYLRTGDADFTVIDNRDLRDMGLTHNYARYRESKEIKMNPFLYYADLTGRSIIQFFTIPGTFKYLNSKGLKVVSKIYGYPWVAFWLIGLLFAGYGKLSHRFLLLTILYFMFTAILVTGLCVGSRFRVPVMPLISILSASGWVRLTGKLRSKGDTSPHRKIRPS